MNGSPHITLGERRVSPNGPMYIIAEMSANHGGDLDRALTIVDLAADAGADAVKLQTYSADGITLRSNRPEFRIGEGTLWSGQTLHDLYASAAMPWDWHAELFSRGRARGLDVFSSPFDEAAVALLEKYDPVAHKIASFELVDEQLIGQAAGTGRPIILSTGMATSDDISRGVAAARTGGASGVALLRCNSAYPARHEEMDLQTIPDMVAQFGCPVGLSDHTLGPQAALTARALGACILEKHFIDDRSQETPDSIFSMEPDEFAAMVEGIRDVEAMLGHVRYGPTEHERPSLQFRRSLYFVKAIKQGERIPPDAVRSVRPAAGLAPRYLSDVIGNRAACDIEADTPVAWELLETRP